MLDKVQIKNHILKQIHHYSNIALNKGYTFTVPHINWDLKGRIAGKGGAQILMFNLNLASQNLEKFLKTTVPHEMAHVLQRRQYPHSKPHGKEWKYFCKVLTGQYLDRCHSYDISFLRKNRLSTEKFACACKEHTFSSVRAKRLKSKKYQYTCKECKEIIKHIPS